MHPIQNLIYQHLSTKISVQLGYYGSDTYLLSSKNFIAKVVKLLKTHPDFSLNLLTDIYGLDHKDSQTMPFSTSESFPIYEVVYCLESIKTEKKAFISVLVDKDDPFIPTLSALFQSAIWLERELWDMFGIISEANPSQKKILTYRGFAGHPLRKNYPFEKVQPLFPMYKDG